MKTNYEMIMEYFEENEDEFNGAMEALDDICGILDDNRWHEMIDLDDELYGYSATDIIDMLDTCFSTSDDYFRIHDGTLESTCTVDYSDYLNEEIIREMIAYKDRMKIDYDLREMLTSKPTITQRDRAFIDAFVNLNGISIYRDNDGELFFRRAKSSVDYYFIHIDGTMFNCIENGEAVEMTTLAEIEVRG